MTGKRASYVDQVMTLFSRRKHAQPESTADSGEASAGLSTDFVPVGQGRTTESDKDRQVFETRLRQFAAQWNAKDSLVAGRIHMLNIDRIRERFGERWPRLAERIHDIIKSELKIRLGQQDLFTQVSESSYVIVFGDCSEIEARLKIALLSERILEKLVGETEAGDLQALGVQRLVARSDGSVAAEALSRTEALISLLDQALESDSGARTYDCEDVAAGRRALTPGEVAHLMGDMGEQLSNLESTSGDAAAPVVKIDRLRELLRQLEHLEAAMLAKASPSTSRRFDMKAGRDGSCSDDASPAHDLVGHMKRRAERQIVLLYDRDPNVPDGGSSAEATPNVRFAYLPMWHAPSKKVGIYVCKPTVSELDEGTMALSRDDQDREADCRAAIDRLALRRAQDDIRNAVSRGLLNVVMVQVHFSTLSRHGSRTKLLELCSNMPRGLRNILSWEVLGSHVDSWSLQLQSAINPIKPFGRGIFLRLENIQDNFPVVRRNLPCLRSAGVHAVGIDVANLSGSEYEQLRLLDRIAELANESGLKCYGHGFDSLSLTICALCAGYDHVSGPAIAEPTAQPDGIRPTALEHIYGRVIFRDAVDRAE